jgi:flagellar protein FlgJ
MAINVDASPALDRVVAKAGETNQKLRKATGDFESFFVGMLMKQMHETSLKGGLLPDSSQSKTYRDMFDDAVSKEIGKSGGFGIGKQLYERIQFRSGEDKP